MTAAYPLAWPEGWPRTPAGKRQDSKYRFKRAGDRGFWSMTEALRALDDELSRLGAKGVVLSSDYERRLDGSLKLNAGAPSDPGVAVYFTLDGRQRASGARAVSRPVIHRGRPASDGLVVTTRQVVCRSILIPSRSWPRERWPTEQASPSRCAR